MSDYLAIRQGDNVKLALESREDHIARVLSGEKEVKYYKITLDENNVPSLSSEVVLAPTRNVSVQKDVATLEADGEDLGEFEV